MERHFSAAVILIASAASAAEAQCTPAPNCDAPTRCVPQTHCRQPSRPESVPEQPEGQYVRGPESGEFAGAAESFGLRGFGLRFPEVRVDLPELRLPHLVKYRRNPEMVVESSRAPFVRGRPLEFNQVDPSEPESTPERPETTPENCVPPVPSCTIGARERERRLMAELSQKEAELQEMRTRFGQLEDAVNRLASQRTPAAIQPSAYEVEQPVDLQSQRKMNLSAPPASRPLSAPATGGQKRSSASAVPVKPAVTQPAVLPEAVSNPKTRQPVGTSTDFGEWKESSVSLRTVRK